MAPRQPTDNADRTLLGPTMLLVIVLAYLVLGSLYAVNTPAWQVPDEPAHYNYIAQVVATGRLPVLQPGDFDAAYLERLKGEKFPPDLPVDRVRYEGWQPPLYYLLAAPVFALSGGSLLAVRLFTLALGSAVILLTYRLGRAVAPASPVIALAAAGFVACLPQHVAMMAAANNDALAETVMGLGLWLGVAALLASPGPRARHWWRLGLLLGAAFVTKLSVYPVAALLGLVLLLLARREGWKPMALLRAAAELYVPALLIGGLWWARNLAVYGGLDFLAMQRHQAVVTGQLRTAEALASWGAGGYLRTFFNTTFQSFWGQFGWMGVVMDRRVYLALLAFTLAAAIGAAAALWAHWQARARLTRSQVDVAVFLTVALLLTVAVYLYYNLSYVQFQGRYLYPALPVFALLVAFGLRQWAALLVGLGVGGRRRPAWAEAARLALTLAPIALMALLAVFALYRFVIPQLSG
jgi:4-amino-4-deoxy-L-arabinose transferase-like glycosyltransferase